LELTSAQLLDYYHHPLIQETGLMAMSRHFVAAFLVLAATTNAPSAPPSKEAEEVTYWFPTTVGDTRVFEETRHNGEKLTTQTETRTVTSVDRTEHSLSVTVRVERDGADPVVETYAHFFKRGLYLVTHDNVLFNPPCCMLRLPYRRGDTWEVNNPAFCATPVKFTVGNEEEVEVPAGKFKAIRIEAVCEQDGRTARLTHWAAAGFGIVKSVNKTGDELKTILVLKSVKTAEKPAQTAK
jgi:hypothetical protein